MDLLFFWPQLESFCLWCPLFGAFSGPEGIWKSSSVIVTALAGCDQMNDNGDDWGMLKKWSIVATVKTGTKAVLPPKIY